jgi:hypothetical protein
MTDRYNALTIVLEKNMREDDAEGLIQALQMMRGVASVTPIVADVQSHIAYERARNDLRSRVTDFLYPRGVGGSRVEDFTGI